MSGLADLHAHPPGEFRGNTEARTENLQDERIPHADKLDAPAQADAEGLEALRVLIVRLDMTHHGTDARGQFVEPYGGGGLSDSCHNDGKISLLPRKSTAAGGRVGTAPSGYQRVIAKTDGGLRFVSGGLHCAVCVENRGVIRQIGTVNFKACSALLLATALFAGCSKTTTPPATPAAESLDDYLPKQAQPKLRTMKIYLGAETFDAELALTPQEEMTGMMFRTNILETDSMLFVLPYTQRASFWMKNCPESISAAYINPDGVIEEIHHLEKNDTNAVVAATENIRFVLETQDGWFSNHHVGIGTVIRTEKGSLADTFLKRQR